MSDPYAPPPPGGYRRPDDGDRRGPDGDRRAPGGAPPVSPGPHGTRHGAHQQPGPHPDSRHGDPHPDSRGGPHPGPPPGPVRPPVDPEAARAASRQAMHFGLLMLASVVTAALPLPWQVAALVFTVVAVVVGVRALRAVWASGLRGSIVVVLAALLGLAALSMLPLLRVLVLWPVQVDLQDCLRDALTISAREECAQEYEEAVTERTGRLSAPGTARD